MMETVQGHVHDRTAETSECPAQLSGEDRLADTVHPIDADPDALTVPRSRHHRGHLLHEQRPGSKLAHFEFRAMRPTFDTQPFYTGGAPRVDGREIDLWARDPQGALAMKAVATLR